MYGGHGSGNERQLSKKLKRSSAETRRAEQENGRQMSVLWRGEEDADRSTVIASTLRCLPPVVRSCPVLGKTKQRVQERMAMRSKDLK
jgi:hypothetical protein